MQKRNLIATRLEGTSMVAGGDGLAHVVHGRERRAVFVPRGAPGDILEAEVDFTCKPARATSIRLLEPSRLRASAPCPHVERAEGAISMHLTLEAQVAAHRDIVDTALARAIRSSSNDATMPENCLAHRSARPRVPYPCSPFGRGRQRSSDRRLSSGGKSSHRGGQLLCGARSAARCELEGDP